MGEYHTYRYINASGVSGSCDLLWTNPSPSAEFVEQTIPLNLTNYDGVLILSKQQGVIPSNGVPTKSDFAIDNLSCSIQYVWKGATDICISTGTYLASSIPFSTGRNIISVSNSGIEFGKNYYMWSYSGHNNAYGIPCKIWGVKHGGALSW